jgi:hypothetical protein
VTGLLQAWKDLGIFVKVVIISLWQQITLTGVQGNKVLHFSISSLRMKYFITALARL